MDDILSLKSEKNLELLVLDHCESLKLKKTARFIAAYYATSNGHCGPCILSKNLLYDGVMSQLAEYIRIELERYNKPPIVRILKEDIPKHIVFDIDDLIIDGKIPEPTDRLPIVGVIDTSY